VTRALQASETIARIAARDYTIGVIGLGYVGLPLALTACRSGFRVLGFDIDAARVGMLNRGESFIGRIPGEQVGNAVERGLFRATTDFEDLADVDAILIAVPTPLSRQREPDLCFVERAADTIASRLRRGQLVVLESTTWPGTTDEVVRPRLERSGLRSREDFWLAFSPEREDPGNPTHNTATIPKVVGGDGDAAQAVALALYGAFVTGTVPVSSTATAEAVKLTENIFRAVNIALVNELKVIYDKMGIDIWEVIEAAKTKPFGFMPFYPGPGLGGHCIPIDPFYLTWKAREFDVATRFIELAGQINTAMPHYVVDRVAEAHDRLSGRGLAGARILVLGVAYKKNIEDMRGSPALRLIELLEARGTRVGYHDPFVPVIPASREHPTLEGRRSVPLDAGTFAETDLALIATDHDSVDYRAVVTGVPLVVDTRNVCARLGIGGGTVVKA
jgi:UDP-N-acetyl-D-glucosamine dehydrogenase